MPCGSRVAFRLKRRQSYPREPFVAPVLPITALTAPDVRVALDELYAHDVLGHLVAELPLDPQPDRCTVRNRQHSIVQRVRKDGLRMVRGLHGDGLRVTVLA